MKLWDFQKYRELTAVITDAGQCYYYRDLDWMQQEFFSNIRQGSLVCIFAENDMASLIAYLACLLHGVVSVILPAAGDPVLKDSVLQEYEPDYIWLSSGRYEQSSDRFTRYGDIVYLWDYVLLERGIQDRRKLHPDLALLLPTSGSTGSPQLVRLSVQNIRQNTVSICSYMKITSVDRAVTSLPLSYTYGLSLVNTLLYAGGSILLTGKSVVRHSFWQDLEQYGVTIFSGVPYSYECMKKMNVKIAGLEKLRMLTQAGGKLTEELQGYWGMRAFDAGKQFIVMYGQTEATARIAYLPWEDCLKKPGSVGIAIPGTQLELRDQAGCRITVAYEAGEIICRGGQVSMGYAERREDLALGDTNQGCLHTGDTGHFDEDGYLYIDGRMNRFAKIYGKRIDLCRVEKTASGMWEREVIVLSDDKKLYLYTNEDVTESALTLLGRQTGLGKEVMEVRRWGELPRQENGKVNYKFFT